MCVCAVSGCVTGFEGICATAPCPPELSMVWSCVSLRVCTCVQLEETVGLCKQRENLCPWSSVQAWDTMKVEQAHCQPIQQLLCR